MFFNIGRSKMFNLFMAMENIDWLAYMIIFNIPILNKVRNQ